MKSPQRSDVEMIVMRVAEEHRIDWRQVIEVDAGVTRFGPTNEKGPARSDQTGSVRIFTPAT